LFRNSNKNNQPIKLMPKSPRRIKVPDDKIPSTIDTILESWFWLQSVGTMTTHERLHDDNDGTMEGVLNVMFTPDGDARVWITGEAKMPSPTLRFRMPGGGGGLSPRTRVALLILAEAIRQDNEKNPLPK
jgi:hypothetical protein